MQGVPPTARELIRAFAAAALVACALLVASCGGEDDEGGGEVQRPAGLPADFNLQLFDCSDWQKAGPPVRRYVLDQLHDLGNDQVTGPGVPDESRGTVLTDAQATKMFDSTCANPRARGFVLYKIYAFSRGFRGSSPPGS